jgi:shikimate 5-dehydrogenase
MKFVGLNLTVPHKILAVDLVDELDASARQWGAVWPSFVR